MKKFFETTVEAISVIIVLLVMFVLGYKYSQDHQPYVKMTEHYTLYRVYDIKNAFDSHTGEPIYWIVGGKMPYTKTTIGNTTTIRATEPSQISVYFMPRKMANLQPFDGCPDPAMMKDMTLLVDGDGEGLFSKYAIQH